MNSKIDPMLAALVEQWADAIDARSSNYLGVLNVEDLRRAGAELAQAVAAHVRQERTEHYEAMRAMTVARLRLIARTNFLQRLDALVQEAQSNHDDIEGTGRRT